MTLAIDTNCTLCSAPILAGEECARYSYEKAEDARVVCPACADKALDALVAEIEAGLQAHDHIDQGDAPDEPQSHLPQRRPAHPGPRPGR